MEWVDVLRLGVRRTVRNWKLSLAIFLGILFASTLFASINIQANLIHESLLTDVLDALPTDMIWHRSSSYRAEIEVPDTSTLRQWENTIQSVPNVEDTEFFVVHLPPSISAPGDIYYTAAVLHNSSIYNELSVVNGPSSLDVNETYIATSSSRFNDFPIGSNYTLHFDNRLFDQYVLNATIRIAGYVDITDKGKRLLTGDKYHDQFPGEHFPTYFIVDYKQTFVPLLDAYRLLDPEEPNIRIHISIDLNRNTLLNPYNIAGSISRVNQIASQIHEQLHLVAGGSYVENILGEQLLGFQNIIGTQQLTFIFLALPVLFITLYMGITLGDVTFSLRRREIGLLLAKGGTPRQLTIIYLIEALIVGLVAGALGLVLSLLVVSLFSGIGGGLFIASVFLGLDTILLILGFTVILALLSVYLPARKALNIPLPEAMREYSITSEPVRYHKKFAWLCLILGTYQLFVWIFSINIFLALTLLSSGSMLMYSVTDLWLTFNLVLGIIAPLLFTYGFVMVVIKGSPSVLTRVGQVQRRLFGDMGSISAHNVQRRPGRTAAVIFLVALLLAFSIQSIGYLASSQDWIHRRIYADVGADIRLEVQHPDNVTTLLPIIRGFEGVRGATAQYMLSMQLDYATGSPLRAITVEEWLEVAYYEENWFPSGLAESTLRSLTSINNGLVLEYQYALEHGYSVGTSIDVRVWPNRTIQTFTVTGVFGPKPIEYQPASYRAEHTWSYTMVDVLDTLGSSGGYDCFLLIRLTSSAANSDVRAALSAMNGVIAVTSAIDIIAEFHTDPFLAAQTSIIQLVVFFAYILTATVTFIVFYLGLLERRRITALMNQRGGSFRQLVTILAGEALIVTVFAILIGFIVGFIAYYGVVQGADFRWPVPRPPLVAYQFMPGSFIPLILVQLLVIVGILLIAPLVIVPVEVKRAQQDLSALR